MLIFCYLRILLFVKFVCVTEANVNSIPEIKQLVIQWAPLIWMSPEEKYFPSNVEDFVENVHLENENGAVLKLNKNNFPSTETDSFFLVTNKNLESLKNDNTSFIHGKSPNGNSVPVYAVITFCTPYKSFHSSAKDNLKNDIDLLLGDVQPNLFFHVTYWVFHPYNEGKKICFLGKVPVITIFGRCFGHLKIIGNHVGDWEHMSLSFKGQLFPSHLYLAVHDFGSYYKYDPNRRLFKFESHRNKKRLQSPKFPPIVRLQSGHPVLFSSDGSHGLWSAPGEHEFVKLPRLVDKCAYGVPWKTWNNVKMYFENFPDWVTFSGKWGNPKSECFLFKKLGMCVHTDGPPGILRTKGDFLC